MPEKKDFGFPFNLSRGTENGSARAAALERAAAAVFQPTAAVSYRSNGRLLIIGSGAAVADAVSRLAVDLNSILVLSPPGEEPPGLSDAASDGKVTRLSAVPTAVSGYLGNFEVHLQGPEGEVGLQSLSADEQLRIDLVLDLSVHPCLAGVKAPHGYFAPVGDSAVLESALAQIPQLVGEFEQPQYIRYDPDICAHARSGIAACRRCLDACSSNAIHIDGERIQVDPHLCQGEGSCTSACPSGALRYAYPRPSELLETLKGLLGSYRIAGGRDGPTLLFHDRDAGRAQLERIAADLPDWMVPVEVEEIGSVGLEVWLTALACGAVAVTLLGSAQSSEATGQEMQRQLSYAWALLDGIGFPSQALQFQAATDDDGLLRALRERPGEVRVEPATFALFDDKRTMIHLALDHLHRYAPQPRPLVLLPTGAAFGEVWLSAERCTLCMACVTQCPGKALQSGDDLPQLKFVEDNCVQCGLCARSCPENAIGPSPRYLFDSEQRRRALMLKEDEPFRCIVCGKPFATAGVIGTVMGRLRGHTMYGPAELERLKMCEDCRVRALYEQETETLVRTPENHP